MEKITAPIVNTNSLVDIYNLINQLFPFHFVIDAQFKIIQVGKNIKKINPLCKVNDAVQDHFKLVRPNFNFSFDNFFQKKKETFIFTFAEKDIHLKGHIICYPSNNSIIFIGNPIIGNGDILLAHNISLNDFAAFDAMPDFLLSQKAQETSLEEIQKLVEKLQDSHKSLIQSNNELKQFSYIVSHDLKSPLRTINNFAQLLKRKEQEQLDNESKEFLDFIISGTTRMGALINDLLEYAKIHQETNHFELIDINNVLEAIKKDLHYDMQQKKATIVYSDLPQIQANPTLIRQVFQNLITNAIKFRKDIPPIINISAEEKEKEWEFMVQDNGIGFDMKQGNKIFQVFQRAVHAENYDGTGIGLAICKKIVEKHKGRIWVKSALNIGSTFHFTICK